MPPRSNEPRPSPGVGNPLEWSVIERCRVMILLTLPFYVGYALRSAYLIGHPEIEPYFAREWLVIMRDGIGALVAFWIVFLLLGSFERRRSGTHTPYVLVGTVSWWVGAAGIAYGLGPITSPAWIAILVGVVCPAAAAAAVAGARRHRLRLEPGHREHGGGGDRSDPVRAHDVRYADRRRANRVAPTWSAPRPRACWRHSSCSVSCTTS